MDLGEQLQIQQQINDLIREREKLLKKQTTAFSQQSQLSQKMCSSLQNCPPAGTEDRVNKMKEGLEGAADEADKVKDSMGEASEAAGGFGDKLGGIAKAGVGLLGVSSIFNKISGIISGVVGLVTSLVRTIWNVGKAIVLLPIHLFSNLIKMIGNTTGGGGELRQAMEDVREQFGSLASNEGKALVGNLGNIRKAARGLRKQGIRMSRVWGYGRKGIAEIVKGNLELAKALGPAMVHLGGIFKKMPVQLDAYRRALGLTAEAEAEVLKHAYAMGEDPVKAMDEFASMAIHMGKQAKISSKVIARAMGEARLDLEHFGHMGTTELGAVTTYAAKLGIGIKDLAGIMDQFLDFEAAAESVGKLSAAMGIQIDVQKLALADNPADQMDILRKAAFRAGKDIKNMSFIERKIWMDATKMSPAVMEAALSLENQGNAYKDVAEGADSAADAQLTQAQALTKLADALKRIVRTDGRQYNSFMDAFLQGVTRGITRTGEFRKIFRFIRRDLTAMYHLGRDVGRMIVKYFPGIQKMMSGFAEIFEPKRFKRELINPLRDAFKTFFKEVGGKTGIISVENFLGKLKKTFTTWLMGGSGGGKKIKEGFGMFMTGVKNIIVGIMPVIIKGLIFVMDSITSFFQNPTSGPLGELWDSISNFFVTMWEEISSHVGPLLPQLQESWATMFNTVMEETGKLLKEWEPTLNEWGDLIIGGLFGGTMGQIIIYAYFARMAGWVLGAMKGIGGIFTGASAASTSMVTKVGKGGAHINPKTIASESSAWRSVGPQMVSMAGTMAIMGVFLWALVKYVIPPLLKSIAEAEGLTVEKGKAFGLIIVSLIGTVGVIMLAAGAMGALIYGSGGLALAAMAAGMLAIGVALYAVMEMLSGFIHDIAPLFKGESASNVVKGIGSTVEILQALPAIMASAALVVGGTGFSLITGSNPFSNITNLLDALMGEEAGKKGLIGAIVRLNELSIKDPKALAMKVGALASVITAIAPILSMNDAFKEMAEDFSLGSQGLQGITEINALLTTHGSTITGTIDKLKDLMIGLKDAAKDITAADARKMTPIAAVISAMATAVKALSGPAQDIVRETKDSGFNQVVRTIFTLGISDDPSEGALAQYGTSMSVMIEALGKAIKDVLGAVMKQLSEGTMTKETMGLFEREGKVMVGLIGAIAKFGNVITSITASLPVEFVDRAGDPELAKKVERYGVALGMVIDVIGLRLMGNLKMFATQTSALVSELGGTDTKVVRGLEVLAKMTRVFSGLITGVSGMAVMMFGKPGEKNKAWNKMKKDVYASRMVGVLGVGATESFEMDITETSKNIAIEAAKLSLPFRVIITSMNILARSIITSFKSLIDSPDITALAGMEDIEQRLDIVSKAMSITSTLITALTSISTAMKGTSNVPIGEGKTQSMSRRELTDKVQELSKENPLAKMFESGINWTKIGKDMGTMIDGIATGIIPVLKSFSRETLGMKVSTMKARVELLLGMIGVIDPTMTAVEKLTAAFVGTGGVAGGGVGATLTQLQVTKAMRGLGFMAMMFDQKKAKKEGFQISESAGSTMDFRTFSGILGGVKPKAQAEKTEAIEEYIRLAETLIAGVPVFHAMATDVSTDIIMGITSTADAINEINIAVSDFASKKIQLEPTFTKFLNAIATGGDVRKVKIEKGNFVMNVCVNIKMDRHKMVKFLSNVDDATESRVLDLNPDPLAGV